jgi:hypothetical protein
MDGDGRIAAKFEASTTEAEIDEAIRIALARSTGSSSERGRTY